MGLKNGVKHEAFALSYRGQICAASTSPFAGQAVYKVCIADICTQENEKSNNSVMAPSKPYAFPL